MNRANAVCERDAQRIMLMLDMVAEKPSRRQIVAVICLAIERMLSPRIHPIFDLPIGA